MWLLKQDALIIHSGNVKRGNLKAKSVSFDFSLSGSSTHKLFNNLLLFLSFSLTFQDKMPVSAVIQADNYL